MKTVLAGLMALAAAGAQPVITATAPITRPGGTVTITVTLTGANGPAVQFFLPQLTGVSYAVSPGTLPAGKSLTCAASPTPAPALFGCIVAGGLAALADGVLATITFPAPAVGSYAMPVSLQLGASGAGDPVPITAGPALSLVVTTPCDLNGDGAVNGTDVALAIQNGIARLISAALDLTGDGVVNVVDVQRVVAAANGGVCRVGP